MKEFKDITEFFNYICNIDSDDHDAPSTSDIYGALGYLTNNFDAHSCEGALEDLKYFRDSIKLFMSLKESIKESDLGDELSKNKQALRNLYINNQGILTAELDITKMSKAEQVLPLYALFTIAIKMRYSKLSFELLDKVEEKLKIEKDNGVRRESNDTDIMWLITDFPDLANKNISSGFKILIREGLITKEKGKSSYKLGQKKYAKTKLAYFIKGLYKTSERIPWSKWEKLLSAGNLASSYNQIKDGKREWQAEMDKLINEAKGIK